MSSASISTAIPAPAADVIRREFDIAEGDAYNKALIDRAERRLKNLNYFKTVKITPQPGSAPDRVDCSMSRSSNRIPAHSTSPAATRPPMGWLGEVKVGERNLLGTGRDGEGLDRLTANTRKAPSFRPRSRIFSAPGFPPASSFLARQTSASSYQSYGSDIYGASLTVRHAVTEQLGVQWRYSLSRQSVTLDPAASATRVAADPQAAAAGPQWVSAVGDTVSYNTLDNAKNPTSGFNSQLKQDLAGLGGDVRFLRTTEDLRYYQPINDDVVALARAPGRLCHRLGRPVRCR